METLDRRLAVHDASAPRHPNDAVPRRSVVAYTRTAGLMLAGCASGINRVEEACAAHRTTAAAFASCLRGNHAVLTSGPPAQRDLATYYLAMAEYQAGRVAAGETTDPEAMFALARFRTQELAELEKKRNDAAKKEWDEAMKQAKELWEAYGKKGPKSGPSGGGTARPVSAGGPGPAYPYR